MNKSLKQVFLSLTSIKCVCDCSHFGPSIEMTDVPFIYFNYKKPLPFHVPEAWKGTPFGGSLSVLAIIVPPPPAPRTVLDTVIILRQFSFFFKRKGGVWDLILRGEGWLIEDLQWVRILHLMQSNGFDSGKGHQGYFAERQIATVRLWSLLIRVRKWVN